MFHSSDSWNQLKLNETFPWSSISNFFFLRWLVKLSFGIFNKIKLNLNQSGNRLVYNIVRICIYFKVKDKALVWSSIAIVFNNCIIIIIISFFCVISNLIFSTSYTFSCNTSMVQLTENDDRLHYAPFVEHIICESSYRVYHTITKNICEIINAIINLVSSLVCGLDLSLVTILGP